ncbi:carbohydrate kinase, thermoresistant glucokinase family [Streptomyces sp. DvalAA-14]|uniref:gluconokinase, GntK/IdnK-type n=1 Tax=unclassified Streptomyces TaxID=2593676 RepID=UPI00081BAC7D|nr:MULTISPECIES: gluconokinase, GntK/IdnK-type [unclassified Streptomyces]MYS22725.1 FCD domain-containing protein [Streptomyces sp. SID4948]SCE21391.1 carbohydrate kinase, thermoresistant glucokinase family [Streptomyces sp. DvalAA-14]
MSDDERGDTANSGEAARGSTARIVAELGGQIVDGGKPRGFHLTVEAVTEELGVTRPMAREALQTLHQKGLVNLQPRIGATVQALGDWDLLDPDVIAWRLQRAPDSQMRSLTELRETIEPRAARLAAGRRAAEICHDLISLAHELHALSTAADFDQPEAGLGIRKRFRDVDALFHRTLLRGSGNELLVRLAHPVEMALNHRIDRDWAGGDPLPAPAAAVSGPHPAPGPGSDTGPGSGVGPGPGPDSGAGTVRRYPVRPQPAAMWFHVGLAHAVDQGLAATAESFAEAILAEIRYGHLQDPVVREQLRAGLVRFNVDRLRATDRAPFREAMGEIVGAGHAPVVVMGVSGSGKSTVGKLLAASLRAPFEEGDSFHSPQNIDRMARGVPLDDRSRSPWLAAIARRAAATPPEEGLVVTCSALKRIYREVLRAAHPDTFFVHLVIDEADATARLSGRGGHFMPASLVASQFDALEPLEPDEAGMTLRADLPPLQIVAEVQARLAARRIPA